MKRTTKPYVKDLKSLGFVEGVTVSNKQNGVDLCHYIGGLPYALPQTSDFRWRKPRSLPSNYSYGTRSKPGRFTKGTSVCPQLSGQNLLAGTDEDCLQLNIWLPTKAPPSGGFPVLFYIHGGFLQFGSPNGQDLSALLSETNFDSIVVMPHYRLNLFGFLGTCETSSLSDKSSSISNFGFYDQRLALVWTHDHISVFGGDPSNITVVGYSAGAFSVFHQMSHDLYQSSPSKHLIARCIMWSNGPGLPPRSHTEGQRQFNELCDTVGISSELTPSEKVTQLRKLSASKLIAATRKLHAFTFRPIRDPFIPKTLFADIRSGVFARRMRSRNLHLMMGDCVNEHFVYAEHRPPSTNSFPALFARLQADYQDPAVSALARHYFPYGSLPPGCADWMDAFGRVYANVQVHTMQRGFAACLAKSGAEDLLLRYRIAWRADCVPLPKAWGATHTSDEAIWFWGNGWRNGKGLKKGEKEIARNALFDLFVKFVHGEDDSVKRGWKASSADEVRFLREDGTITVEKDDLWEEGQAVWNLLMSLGLETEGRDKLARL